MNIFIVSLIYPLSNPLACLLSFKFTLTIHTGADGEECQLSWTRRMKVIIGIAHGLKYFHTELDPPFTISELNSNAVYLTEDFSPKVFPLSYFKFK